MGRRSRRDGRGVCDTLCGSKQEGAARMDTGVVFSVDELDLAELIESPPLVAGGDVLLAEAGARRAARTEVPAVAPLARGSAPAPAARRRRQLRLRRGWGGPPGAPGGPAAGGPPPAAAGG